MKKKILMLVCAFCFVIPAVLFGLTACGTKDTTNTRVVTDENGLRYRLFNGNYSVVGLDDYDETYVSIPAKFKNKPVTRIEEGAFEDCENLTHITIPKSVTSIGHSAFSDSFSLEGVNYEGNINDWVSINFGSAEANPLYYGAKLHINQGIITEVHITTTEIKPYALRNCRQLTDVILGENVEIIGNDAFYFCDNLETLQILSDSHISIGRMAFYACFSLKEVIYSGNINDWVSIDFAHDASNPLDEGVKLIINDQVVTTANITATEIKPYAFDNYNQLTSLILDKSVKTIGNSVFSSSIEEVIYNGNINDWVSINFADGGANPLSTESKLIINDQVVTTANITATEIKPYAFSGYDQLTSVNLVDGVISIGDGAFQWCSNLGDVSFPNTTTTIKRWAFKGCSNFKSVIIGNNVTSIEYAAFENCSNLESVIIGNNITIIEDSLFENCSNLKSVIIGNNVTSIGYDAFKGCSNLDSITIPQSVTSIRHSAFDNCSALATVIIDGETVANALAVGAMAYMVYDAQTIYVKSGLSVSNSTYLLLNFRKQATSDKVGYDMYVRNAE